MVTTTPKLSRPGYKESDVGVIPEDWETIAIGDIAKFTSGAPINVTSLHQRSADHPVPVFGGNGIAGYTSKPLVGGPAVIVGRVGQKCGTVYLSEVPAWVTDNALYPERIRRPVDLGFLALALEYVDLNEVRNHNDLPLVTQGILHSVRIPWPPDTAEQRTIAAALADVDALGASISLMVAKKQHIRSGALRELLTGKRRLPGFRGEWEVKRLGDIADIQKGKGLSKGKLDDSGTQSCILYGELFTTYSEEIKVVKSRTSCLEGVVSKPGDVLLPGSTTTTGIDLAKASALAFGGVLLGGDIIILRNTAGRFNPIFLAYTLTHIRKHAILKATKGITIYHLHGRDLIDLEVTLPPVEEQARIAAILSDMADEIEALEARRQKTCALKQAMMQQLLTGHIRLI